MRRPRGRVTRPLPSPGVATVVFLHTHPPEECLMTGGTLYRSPLTLNRLTRVVGVA